MRTRRYRGGKRRSMKAGRKKSYKGGQPRWPAPSNPTPPPSCWFPHFRPLLLSQFGGKYTRRRSGAGGATKRRGGGIMDAAKRNWRQNKALHRKQAWWKNPGSAGMLTLSTLFK